MKCNHCLTAFNASEDLYPLGNDSESGWALSKFKCPECEKFNLFLIKCLFYPESATIRGRLNTEAVRPRGASRVPPSREVPNEYTEDYKEACLVLTDSAKASAALSRRCLQHLLREELKVKPDDLVKEIQEVLNRGNLPSHISESLDAVRNIGNFAAHPIKSKSSGEIVPVEEGEAEWNLDVLEALFDYLFVQPDITKKKKADLNKKLRDAGKPEIK